MLRRSITPRRRRAITLLRRLVWCMGRPKSCGLRRHLHGAAGSAITTIATSGVAMAEAVVTAIERRLVMR